MPNDDDDDEWTFLFSLLMHHVNRMIIQGKLEPFIIISDYYVTDYHQR